MFKRLKEKWRVNSFNLLLILSTFALGGTLCGRLGSKILSVIGIEKGGVWLLLYILLITLLWPVSVLLISIPLGQFRFFKNYISRIWNKLLKKKSTETTTRIAILASGNGTNTQNIINHLNGNTQIVVGLIISDRPDAGVIQIAQRHNIPSLIVSSENLKNGSSLINKLTDYKINYLILAGFLKKIPDQLIAAFPNKIINIHPSLLPAYGGKGMYGKRVHEAVISNGEKSSGISIHYVDNEYDHGEIIFQARCPVEPNDTPESLEAKIRQMEHTHYPRMIEELIQKQTHS